MKQSFLIRCAIATRFALLAACICIVSATAIAAPKVQYKFQFNPPSGTTYTTTCISTKVIDNGISEKRVDVSTTKEQITITKTDDGYSVGCRALSVEKTRNGKKVPPDQDLAMQALTQVTLTFRLDANGKLTAIDGIEELNQVFDTMLDGLDKASSGKQEGLNKSIKKGLVDSITAEWNNRIVGFVGETTESGDMWASMEKVVTPFGDINVIMKTYFGNPVVLNKHDCVKLGFAYTADKKSIGEFISNIMELVAKPAEKGSQTPKVIGATLTGKGHRIVDPSTMLIYAEEVHRTVRMRLSIPGRDDVVTTYNESKVYSFDYSN